MQSTLYLEIVSSLADEGFSLDELVLQTKALFEQEGMPGFVGLLLLLFDEQLTRRLLAGTVVPGVPACGCGHARWELCAVEPRRLRTSIGTVPFQWGRLRCPACGKSVIPLREVLHLDRHQSKTAELERIVAEIVSEQSYRRTFQHLKAAALLDVPPMNAQRWVMQSAWVASRIFRTFVEHKRPPGYPGSLEDGAASARRSIEVAFRAQSLLAGYRNRVVTSMTADRLSGKQPATRVRRRALTPGGSLPGLICRS